MIYLGTFSKILSPGVRVGWVVAPRPVLEKLNLGKQGADLCSSPLTQLFVATYLRNRTGGLHPVAAQLYRKRRDTMLGALAEHFGEQASWTKPQGGLFVWFTLPSSSTPPTCWRGRCDENVAFVPGRAAYLDGRGGILDAPELRRHPRAGHPRGDPAHRQGRGVQMGLFGTLTRNGSRRRPTHACRAIAGRLVSFPSVASAAPGQPMKVAVLKGGRSLERQVSLRSGAQIEDALQRLGHETTVIDVGPELIKQVRAAKPDVAFIALHGRDGEDGTVQELLGAIGVPYTGSGLSACIRSPTRCSPSTSARRRRAHARLSSFNETAFRELARRARCRTSRPPWTSRWWSSPPVRAAPWASASRGGREVPGALLAAFSYDRKVLLERYIQGRDLAVSVLDAAPAGSDSAPPRRCR